MWGIALSCANFGLAATVQLAWDPSLDSTVTGYKIRYGLSSRNYSEVFDAGANTTATIELPARETAYFFSVVAYNGLGRESDYSNEISYETPANTAPILGPISDVSTTRNVEGEIVLLSITDAETPTADLTVQAISSTDTTVAPMSGIQFAQRGAARLMVIVPGRDAVGESIVTIRVTDPQGLFTERSFKFSVHSPGVDPPDNQPNDSGYAGAPDGGAAGDNPFGSAGSGYLPPSVPYSFPAPDAAQSSLTPLLQSSPFLDPDGDAHAASDWQVMESTGTGIVWESLYNTTDKTSIEVPAGILTNSSTYWWHVRYQDDRGLWSDYSLPTSFTTVGPPNTPPILDPIPDVVTTKNTESDIVTLGVSDLESPTTDLTIRAVSSTDSTVAPMPGIQFALRPSGYLMIVVPGHDAVGESFITIRVTDSQGLFSERSFRFEVR